MLYSEFLQYSKHFIEISNRINDGWTLNTYGDFAYLVKTAIQRFDSSLDFNEIRDLTDFSADLEIDNQQLETPDSNSDIRKWEYHVLYSISFAVPVLYFNVWKSNGELLSLDELWENVHPAFKKQVFDNKWYTLTQQEHPYLHRPYFYFHPCQTSAFMKNFASYKNNILITWLSSVGQVIGLYLDELYGQHCSLELENR